MHQAFIVGALVGYSLSVELFQAMKPTQSRKLGSGIAAWNPNQPSLSDKGTPVTTDNENQSRGGVAMLRKRSLSILFLIISLLPSCVSKAKYVEANRNLADIQTRYTDLEEKNLQLAREIDNLHSELQQRQSTIQEQETLINQLDKTRQDIENSLKQQLEAQEVKIEEMEGKLKVTFIDKILFDTGSAEINQRGQEILMQIAVSLKENESQNILVEGHTDNVPIGIELTAKYPTNWELSTARATAVVRFFQEKAGVAPERLAACGYSYYRSVASNETEEGRRQNRRIEIILTP